jgi:hypothetical protein
LGSTGKGKKACVFRSTYCRKIVPKSTATF